MKVVVDYNLCESNAKCMAVAPSVFLVDEDDVLTVLMEHPPEELRDQVELAVQKCPKAAISIVEDGEA
jgi:ferredoxin